VERSRVYYKGEGDGFPQVRAVVSLVCPCCPWFVLAPKVLQLCTNHFVWVVCRPVWVIEACQLFLVPSWSSNTPLYPSKCCELRSVPRLLPLPLFCTWTHFWVPQGVWSESGDVVTKFWYTLKNLDLNGLCVCANELVVPLSKFYNNLNFYCLRAYMFGRQSMSYLLIFKVFGLCMHIMPRWQHI
jgi:hypothetical protein